jgi:alcohol dehydrogenase
MKAAILNKGGSPLEIQTIEEPDLLAGGIKIQVERAMVPSFAGAVLSGNMPFALPVPYIPGPSCVGVVEEVADDVFGFTKGQRVFCGPHFVSKVNGGAKEEILIGWFGLTPGSGPLMNRWKNGAFAEKAVYPAACVTPLGDGDPDDLIKIAPLCISYGGLLKGELRPGQTLLVNGATGNLGSAAVLVALALGAAQVFAVGRNTRVLEQLSALDSKRVTPIPISGNPETYPDQIAAHTQGVDVVLDLLGYVESPALTLAAISQLKPGGIAVFMGGVLADIPINYMQTLAMQLTIRGAFMHPVTAAGEIMKMVRAGMIDLAKIDNTVIPFEEINQAIAKAPEYKGLSCSTIKP